MSGKWGLVKVGDDTSRSITSFGENSRNDLRMLTGLIGELPANQRMKLETRLALRLGPLIIPENGVQEHEGYRQEYEILCLLGFACLLFSQALGADEAKSRIKQLLPAAHKAKVRENGVFSHGIVEPLLSIGTANYKTKNKNVITNSDNILSALLLTNYISSDDLWLPDFNPLRASRAQPVRDEIRHFVNSKRVSSMPIKLGIDDNKRWQMFASSTGQSSSWSFWREWYQGFLDGVPMNWELQRRVALIGNAIWEAGPEAVAEEIERIRAEWLAEQLPQAERVEFNPDSGKFFVTPIEVAKPDLLGATLNQVSDALDDAMENPSNGLHDRSREVRVLQRVFTKYGNDPQQIEMSLVGVYGGLTRQILSEELPPSEENLALQAAVEEGARAIRATHPEVAENRKILSEQAFRELPEGAVEQLEAALPVLRAISEPDLVDDWEHDIPALINDATGPLPSGAPALPGADEATRVFSRAAKIGILIRAKDAIEEHPLYATGAVLLTLNELIKLGGSILALLF